MSNEHDFESPVDLPRTIPPKHPLLWTTVTLIVAALILFFTNAISLRDWIEEQPAGPMQARVAAIITDWQGATDGLGLGTPRATLHEWWLELEAKRFGKEGITSDQS